MRFAIWTAVSTKSQATTDKVSLAEQEEKSRSSALARGWLETVGPFVVPGATRSFYVNLSDAEKDIPQLRQMLEDARNDKFDVLVIYSYDRLGDLVDMIAQSLRFYGKQIYSVSQPVEPQDPAHFDPYAAEAEAIMRDAARITQRFRINDLRRKYKAGMPVRVKKGLNPTRVPFGYRWEGKKVPPSIVPEEAALLSQMKDMLLRGVSTRSIVRFANSTGTQPPQRNLKWDSSTVRYMLRNPFYAGFVIINKTMMTRDPRRKNQKRSIELPRSKWTIAKGLHKPLWSEETHVAIVNEYDLRREALVNYGVRFALSGLLTCSVCGRKLYRRNNGNPHSRKGRWKALACSREHGDRQHVNWIYDEALDAVLVRFSEKLHEMKYQKRSSNNSNQYEAAVEELNKRRKRVQEGYEAGLYEAPEATQKLAEIESEIERLRLKMEEGHWAAISRNEFLSQMPHYDLNSANITAAWVMWAKQKEPEFLHRLLISFCREIVVTPDHRIEIVLREEMLT